MLGLPPGLSVPLPLALGTQPFVFSLCGQAPQVCSPPAVWDAIGETLLRYSPWIVVAAIMFQPTPVTAERQWELTNIQNSKGGKQNVAHPYTLGKASDAFPDAADECEALKRLMDWARKNGDSKLFNDAKATWKQYCRGR
jgi:hypothetical protein